MKHLVLAFVTTALLAASAIALPSAASAAAASLTYGSTGAGNPKTSDCTVTVASTQSIQSAINRAGANAVICVPAGNRSAEAVTLNKGVVLRATGAVSVKTVTVSGSAPATLDGFTVVGPATHGVVFSGTGHRIVGNMVKGRGLGTGIGCERSACGSGHLIAGNTITGLNNYGIWLGGGSSTIVERNNIYDLYAAAGTSGDVDAIRFWGTDHRIRHNYIHDINEFKSATGPHPDCFQTYQVAAGTPVQRITIENNLCVRVSRQCLIASNNLRGSYEIRDIVFRGNVCETFDSSTINLGSVAGVSMENNSFFGGFWYQIVVVDNTLLSGLPNMDIRMRNNLVVKTKTSAAFFYQNSTKALIEDVANLYKTDTSLFGDMSAFHTAPYPAYPARVEADFTRFRSLAASYGAVGRGTAQLAPAQTTDVDGRPRVVGTLDVGAHES